MSKPARPCSQPGCPNLTHERLCPERTRAEDARCRRWQRASKINRRHGPRWRKIRAAYITTHLLCEDCLAANRYTPARRKPTTSSRWSTAAPRTWTTSARCVSCATPAGQCSPVTDGGRNRVSTHTESAPCCALAWRRTRTSKIPPGLWKPLRDEPDGTGVGDGPSRSL